MGNGMGTTPTMSTAIFRFIAASIVPGVTSRRGGPKPGGDTPDRATRRGRRGYSAGAKRGQQAPADWLSVLEASYIVFRLPPYYRNLGKRLVKSPKIYFSEVGLAAYLLGIQNAGQVEQHPLFGNLFENMLIED